MKQLVTKFYTKFFFMIFLMATISVLHFCAQPAPTTTTSSAPNSGSVTSTTPPSACGTTFTSEKNEYSFNSAADFGIVLTNGCAYNIEATESRPLDDYLIDFYYIFNPGNAAQVDLSILGVTADLAILDEDGNELAFSNTGTLTWTVDHPGLLRYVKVAAKQSNFSSTLTIQGSGNSGGCGTTIVSDPADSHGLNDDVMIDVGMSAGCTITLDETRAGYPLDDTMESYFRFNPALAGQVQITSNIAGTEIYVMNALGQILGSGTDTLTWTVNSATAPRYIHVKHFTLANYNLSLTINGL